MRINPKRPILLIILIQYHLISGQNIVGTYQDTCCKWDIFRQLTIKADSTFDYECELDMGQAKTSGKWIQSGDTLKLFDFTDRQEFDTVLLRYDPRIPKDSILIINEEESWTKGKIADRSFIINEDCQHPIRTVNGQIMIAKRAIYAIRIFNESWFIGSSIPFNSIRIKVESITFIRNPRLGDIADWIFKDNKLYPLECDLSYYEGKPWVKK